MSADPQRRWFLAGMAAAALPLGAVNELIAAPGDPALRLLYDPRHFAARPGCAVPLEDTLPQFRRLLATPGAIAGLTGYPELTLMADLARHSGRQLLFHAYYTTGRQITCRIIADARERQPQPQTRLVSVRAWERWLAVRLLDPQSSQALPRQRTDRHGCTVHAWRFAATQGGT